MPPWTVGGLMAAFVALQCGMVLCQEEPGMGYMQAMPDEMGMAPNGLGAAMAETAPASKTPNGDFPTQERRDKAAGIERAYLAKQKVMADDKDEKFQKKVMKVRVGQFATYVTEKKTKQQRREEKYTKKVIGVRQEMFNAQRDQTAAAERAGAENEAAALEKERANKAGIAFDSMMKKAEALKMSEGTKGRADRMAATKIVSGLRIAKAYADGSLAGLTKEQRKNEAVLNLHRAIENAAGNPTDQNMVAAEQSIKSEAKDSNQENAHKIVQQNQEVADKRQKAREDELAGREVEQKNRQLEKEQDSERGVKMKAASFNDITHPEVIRREDFQKKTSAEVLGKWKEHEMRLTEEFQEKGQEKLKQDIEKEKDSKKKEKAKKKILTEECKLLETKKMKILELRNKAIGQYSAKRKNVLVSQDTMDNAKGHDPCTEKSSYASKGKECQKQDRFVLKVVPGGGCDKKCDLEKGNCEGYNDFGNECYLLTTGGPEGGHPECGVNQQTGNKDCNVDANQQPQTVCNKFSKYGGCNNNGDCTMYKAIAGFGSMGAAEAGQCISKLCGADSDGAWKAKNPEFCSGGRRLLGQAELVPAEDALVTHGRQLLGSGPPPPPPPPPQTPSPTALPTLSQAQIDADSGKKKEKKVKAEEISQKEAAVEEENKEAKLAESMVKKDTKNTLSAESSSKQNAINENLSKEKEKKAALAEAGRQAANAEEAMQEMNVKAADIDTQNRKCEGKKFRRRRTCACDDTAPPPPPGRCSAKAVAGQKNNACAQLTTPAQCTSPCMWTSGPSRKLLSETTVSDLLLDLNLADSLKQPRVGESARFGGAISGAASYMSPFRRRRRRTPPPPPPTPQPTAVPTPVPYSEHDRLRDQKKMANWERRRYIRRRYVAPTAADRRRRYAFPAAPPKPRVPSAICPCKSRL